MEFVTEVHRTISLSTVLFMAALGVWGLVRSIRDNGVDGSYMGALVIGELLFVVQALLGVILVIAGENPGRVVHFIYGAFALVALPGLFAYLRGDDSNRAQWLYTIATLFLAGVAVRAIGTGAGG
jgi:heme A synthase